MAWPSPMFVIRGLWIVWVVTWFSAALWSARTIREVPCRTFWRSHLVVAAGAILLFAETSHWLAEPRLWPGGRSGGLVLASATLAALLFTWWGRVHLGRLWSGMLTRKEVRRFVDIGPCPCLR